MLTFNHNIGIVEQQLISNCLHNYNLFENYLYSDNLNTRINVTHGIHFSYDVNGNFHFNIQLYRYGIIDSPIIHIYIIPMNIKTNKIIDIKNIENIKKVENYQLILTGY